MIKEAWIYNEISASLHKEAGETLQGHKELHTQAAQQTPIARKWRLQTGCARKAGHRLSKNWQQGMQTPLTGNSCSHYPKDGPASQEGRLIHSSERKGFSVTLRWLLAIWANCQQSITFFLPTLSWRSSHANQVLQIRKWKDLRLTIKTKRNFRAM